jgi:hypothetical protein
MPRGVRLRLTHARTGPARRPARPHGFAEAQRDPDVVELGGRASSRRRCTWHRRYDVGPTGRTVGGHRALRPP